MKLEDQVTSLAPSKRLEELGVKQESYFCWAEGRDYEGGATVIRRYDVHDVGKSASDYPYFYAAFTVSDLAPMFIHLMEVAGPEAQMNLPKDLEMHDIKMMYQPDYMAKVVVWGIENNLITV